MSSSNNVIDLEKAFHAKIREIQRDLNAPKSEWNSFAKYKYRTCEGILEAVKPLLLKCQLDIKIDDEIIYIDNRHYVKSTATLTDGQFTFSATSSAREPEQKKGFNESQLTGATISYARKYALNGLFAIDDSKDADTNEYSQQKQSIPINASSDEILKKFTDGAIQANSYDALKALFKYAFKNLSGEHQKKAKQVYDLRKSELEPTQ